MEHFQGKCADLVRQKLIIVPKYSLSPSSFLKQKPLVLAGHLTSQRGTTFHSLVPTWMWPYDSAIQWDGIRSDVSSQSFNDEAAWAGLSCSFPQIGMSAWIIKSRSVPEEMEGLYTKRPGSLSDPGLWSFLASPDYSLWTIICKRNSLLRCPNT